MAKKTDSTAAQPQQADFTQQASVQAAHQQCQALGVDPSHLEQVARAAGGRNWGNLLTLLAGVLTLLKDSGLLQGDGTPPTPPG